MAADAPTPPHPCISIHAPREGCDKRLRPAERVETISIHAPREGCDQSRIWYYHTAKYFNPRTPRGVRLAIIEAVAARERFQSTHPARGATQLIGIGLHRLLISIHAPREGCDFHLYVLCAGGSEGISIHAPREGCDILQYLPASMI